MHSQLKASSVWVLLTIMILAGCTQTEEEVLQAAETSASNVFYDKESIETNYESDSFTFYLPTHTEVVEIEENNVILESKNHTYIIFYNDLEKEASRLHYDSASDDAALVFTAFERDDLFGYIRIMDESEEEEDQYELQVGIGGVKITTYTTKKEISKESEELMKIAKSIIESDMT